MPELMSVSDWHYVDAPGTLGVTYGMQEQKSAILAGRAAAGFGVRLGKKLSIGATVGADYNSNTLHAPYIFQSQPVLMGLKTLLDLHTNGYRLEHERRRAGPPHEKGAGRPCVEIPHGNQQHRDCYRQRERALHRSRSGFGVLRRSRIRRRCRTFFRSPYSRALPGTSIRAGSSRSRRTG